MELFDPVTATSNIMKPVSASKGPATGAKVEHRYTDYATADMKVLVEKEHPVHAPGPGGDPPFPVKLHHVLKELKKDDLDNIVGWQPHGRCFIVRNTKEFADRVLPLYFRQTKLQSFQRQLNLYGFKRLTHGPDKGGYYHELFLRGMPELAARIVRTTVKNKGPRKAASPSTEPNLYVYAVLDDNGVAGTTREQKQQPPAPAVLKPTPVENVYESPTLKAGATHSRFAPLFTQTRALLADCGMPPTGHPVVSPITGACFDRPVTSNAMSLLALSGFIVHGEASLSSQSPPRGLTTNSFGFAGNLSLALRLNEALLSQRKNHANSTPGLSTASA